MSFVKRKVAPDTWVLEGEGAYAYLLTGKDTAMLVDSGMSRHDIHAFCKTITDLPITGVINTHGHFDHTGGNGYFDKVYMHPLAAETAKTPFGYLPPDAYPLDYEPEFVKEGQVFNLGERELEIIFIGAHSPGSLAILDRSNRLLFTGDELEAGQVLLIPSGYDPRTQTVENHLRQMLKLRERMDEFDYICPSHNGTMIDKSYVDYFIETDELILSGKGVGGDLPPDMAWLRRPDVKRFEHNDAAICYIPSDNERDGPK